MSNAIMPERQTTIKRKMAALPLHLWLTVPVVIATFIVALMGLWSPDLYGNSDSLAAQGQAQDLVTLLVALPLLIISTWYTARGSIRWRLIWLGTLIYMAYTYVIAAFQVNFNQLFLLYVVVLGSSFYALVLGFASTKPELIQLKPEVPVRGISLIAGFLVLSYYGLWLSEILPALQSNSVPPAIVAASTPTSAVHVLDMGFYLPLMLTGAILLWLRQPMGFVVTGAALAFAPLMGIAVIAMVINLVQWGLAESMVPVAIFAVTTLLTGGALIWLLRCLKS